jgi:hypothetical protein
MRALSEIETALVGLINNVTVKRIEVLDYDDCVVLAEALNRLRRYEAAAVALRQNVKGGILQIVKASPAEPPLD